MGSLDDIPSYSEHLELKKDSIRKAILMLALQWKDLDEHLDCDENNKPVDVGQKLADLEEKHRVLRSEEESLAERNRELDSVRESLNVRFEELECREEKFHSLQLEKFEEIKTREEILAATRTWVVERVKEFELREERLTEKKKSIELLLERIERGKDEFLNIKKSIGKRLDVIGLRQRHCEDRCIEIDAIQDFVLGRVKELDSREKRVRFIEEQVEAMRKTNEQRWKKHEMTYREQSNVLNSVQVLLERKVKELGEREKQIELREMQIKAVPFNEKQLQELELKVIDRYRVIDSLRDLADTWATKLDSGGRQAAVKKFIGLQEKLYDYIRDLVKKGQHLNAIRYVCMFDLGDDFPPADLLKGYISHLEEAVEKIRKEGDYSLKAQVIAINKELNSLKEMMNRIKLHKLESEYALESLEARVEQLQRQKIDLESFAWSPPIMAQPQERSYSQEREIHTKKRKGFVPEHASEAQPTQPLFPIPVPCHLIPRYCLVGSTSSPQNMGQSGAGALVQGGFSSSGTGIECPLLHGWSSTWP